MADYTTIANSQVEPRAPVTSELVTALRDNPIAIAEGATGAPSLGPGIVAITPGDVGSYVLARLNGATGQTHDLGGNTVSGSALRTVGFYEGTTANDAQIFLAAATTLAGTWRPMGYANGNSANNATTLWLRIL